VYLKNVSWNSSNSLLHHAVKLDVETIVISSFISFFKVPGDVLSLSFYRSLLHCFS